MRGSWWGKVAFSLAGPLALVLIFFMLILPKVVDLTLIKEKIEAQIGKSVGFTVKIKGKLTIYPLPKAIISCDDVTLSNDALGSSFHVKNSVIKVDLFKLINGTIDIKEINLKSLEGKIDFNVRATKLEKNQKLTGSSEAQGQSLPKSFEIKNLKLIGGTVSLIHESSQYIFENIEINCPIISSTSRSLMNGSFTYKKMPCKFDLATSPLNTFFEGNNFSFNLKLNSKDILESDLNGVLIKKEGIRFSLRVVGKMTDVNAFGGLMGLDLRDLKGTDAKGIVDIDWIEEKICFKGKLSLADEEVDFSGDYHPLKEQLRVYFHSEAIDLSKLIKGDKGLSKKEVKVGEVRREPKDKLDNVKHKPMQIQLEANIKKVFYLGVEFLNNKISASFSGEDMLIEKISSNCFEGNVDIRGSLNMRERVFKGKLNVSAISLKQMLQDLADYSDLSAKVSANISVDYAKIERNNFFVTTEARAIASFENGSFRNNQKLIDMINFIGFLKGDFKTMEFLSYEVKDAHIKMHKGKIGIEKGELFSDIGDASLSGEILLERKMLDIVAKPKRLKIKAPLAPIRIYGPFDNIKVRPELKDILNDRLEDLIGPIRQRLLRF